MRPLPLLRALALVVVPVASLAAQVREAPESPSGRRIVPCVGQLIEQIVIYAEAPSVASLRRVPIVAKVAQTMLSKAVHSGVCTRHFNGRTRAHDLAAVRGRSDPRGPVHR